MSSQSISLSLRTIGKGMKRLKGNDLRNKKGLRIQVREKMWLLTRNLVQLIRDMDLNPNRSIIKVVAEKNRSVGFVAKICWNF